MRGPIGETVRLKIERAGEAKPLDFHGSRGRRSPSKA